MSADALDAFSAVVGARRGAAKEQAPARDRTDLDRARELLPLVGEALAGQDVVTSVVALRHRARQLNVEVIHGVFTGDETFDDVEAGLTLLRSGTGVLIGVVELDEDGRARLLRPDRPKFGLEARRV